MLESLDVGVAVITGHGKDPRLKLRPRVFARYSVAHGVETITVVEIQFRQAENSPAAPKGIPSFAVFRGLRGHRGPSQ